MFNEPIKLYKYDKAITIMGYIVLGLLLLGVIVLMVCECPKVEALVVLSLLGALIFVLLIFLLIRPSFVEVNSRHILEKNVFGIIKRKREVSDLKEVSIITLSSSVHSVDDYLCLNFSDNDYTNYDLSDLLAEKNVIVFVYPKKHMEELKQFIKMPIIDRRTSNRT